MPYKGPVSLIARRFTGGLSFSCNPQKRHRHLLVGVACYGIIRSLSPGAGTGIVAPCGHKPACSPHAPARSYRARGHAAFRWAEHCQRIHRLAGDTARYAIKVDAALPRGGDCCLPALIAGFALFRLATGTSCPLIRLMSKLGAKGLTCPADRRH